MRALISTKCFHHPPTAAPCPKKSIKALLSDKGHDAKKVARLAKKPKKKSDERAAQQAAQEAKAKAPDKSFLLQALLKSIYHSSLS